MRYFITGIDGRWGQDLVRFIEENDSAAVVGGTLSSWPGSVVEGVRPAEDLAIHPALTEIGEDLPEVLAGFKPDVCFCLDRLDEVLVSFMHVRETLAVNIYGAIDCLEALRLHCPQCRVVLPSSYLIYAPRSSSAPCAVSPLSSEPVPEYSERCHVLADTPYAVTMLALDNLVAQYYHAYKLPVVGLRPFTVWEKLPSPQSLQALLERCAGLEPARHRCLSRLACDCISQDDWIRALWLASRLGHAGEVYNVSRGQVGHILGWLVPSAKERSGCADTALPDPSADAWELLKEACVKQGFPEAVAQAACASWSKRLPLAGNFSRFREDTGWLPSDEEELRSWCLQWRPGPNWS